MGSSCINCFPPEVKMCKYDEIVQVYFSINWIVHWNLKHVADSNSTNLRRKKKQKQQKKTWEVKYWFNCLLKVVTRYQYYWKTEAHYGSQDYNIMLNTEQCFSKKHDVNRAAPADHRVPDRNVNVNPSLIFNVWIQSKDYCCWFMPPSSSIFRYVLRRRFIGTVDEAALVSLELWTDVLSVTL